MILDMASEFWIVSASVITSGSNGNGSTFTHEQIIMALITLVGTSIGGLVFTIRNNSHTKTIVTETKEINKAVNNIGPGEHRLYDIVARIEAKQQEFDKAWGNLPDDMDDAVNLTETIHNISKAVIRLEETLEARSAEITNNMTYKISGVDKKLDLHIASSEEEIIRLKEERER